MNKSLSIVNKVQELRRSYNQTVLANIHTVGQIESIAKAFVYLLPGRFSNTELKAECGYTSLNLLTFYHDSLCYSSARHQNIPPILMLLSVLQFIELVVEIFAHSKWGNQGKWRAAFLIEILKALLRLRMYVQSRGKLFIQEGVPSRAESLNTKKELVDSNRRQQRRTLRDEQREKKEQTENANIAYKYSELTFIFRPVVYVCLLWRYGTDKWLPFLISLFMDLSSRFAIGQPQLTPREQTEINRRMLLWLYYIARSPFFDTLLAESALGRAFSSLRSYTIMRPLAPFWEFLEVYRKHYFYTSAS